MNFRKCLLLSIFFVPYFLLSQSSDDLKFLELLPDNQASSISEKLGIQTGKPVADQVRMEDFEDPSFNSLTPKESNINSINQLDFLSGNNTSVFGLDLFKDAPSTFAPIDLAPAPLDYVIGPGDELKIQLFGSTKSNRLVPVNREGKLITPELGAIELSGLNFS